jgi:hypothetical protein
LTTRAVSVYATLAVRLFFAVLSTRYQAAVPTRSLFRPHGNISWWQT